MTIEIGITNAETQESIVREATEAELDELKETQDKMLADRAVREQKKQEKLALLNRLGITEEEAALLFS
jgi:hypothetical protein